MKRYPDIGIPTKDRWNIDSEYMVVYIRHNYVFYKVIEDTVFIVDIFDESEDVIWRMFRVRDGSEKS